ncbi:hypothetical protein BKA81DRAFT_183028 [Phyllosticta paracitricarpa]
MGVVPALRPAHVEEAGSRLDVSFSTATLFLPAHFEHVQYKKSTLFFLLDRYTRSIPSQPSPADTSVRYWLQTNCFTTYVQNMALPFHPLPPPTHRRNHHIHYTSSRVFGLMGGNVSIPRCLLFVIGLDGSQNPIARKNTENKKKKPNKERIDEEKMGQKGGAEFGLD